MTLSISERMQLAQNSAREWAASMDMRAMTLYGSLAAQHADEYSDIDLMVFGFARA
jgi:predicted nucleotidyltransferase